MKRLNVYFPSLLRYQAEPGPVPDESDYGPRDRSTLFVTKRRGPFVLGRIGEYYVLEALGFILGVIKTSCLWYVVTHEDHKLLLFYKAMFKDYPREVWAWAGLLICAVQVIAFATHDLTARRVACFGSAMFLFSVGVYGARSSPTQPAGWENVVMGIVVMATFVQLLRKQGSHAPHRAVSARRQGDN